MGAMFGRPLETGSDEGNQWLERRAVAGIRDNGTGTMWEVETLASLLDVEIDGFGDRSRGVEKCFSLGENGHMSSSERHSLVLRHESTSLFDLASPGCGACRLCQGHRDETGLGQDSF